VKKSLQEHKPTNERQFFPLVFANYGEEEILRAIEVLLSGKLTMGERVLEFEKKFAEYLDCTICCYGQFGFVSKFIGFVSCFKQI